MSAPGPGTNASAAAAVSAAVDPLVGAKLGAYRLHGRLGEGGMGTVYAAEHELIGRKAAIKLLHPQVSTDEEAVSRFFTEARSVNQIRHPNIVEVTDFGVSEGRTYIVMEYLEGETLAARLDRCGLLDPPSAVHIARQVASALGAAHERGMVHRDLKPGNVFLRDHPDYPDFVKVLDFGIAKLLAPDSTVGHQTRVGSLLGTPSYMSPEQCLGDPSLDHRSDVYSLGVLLYALVTGRLPFKDGPLGQMIMAHVTEVPPAPAEVNRAVPRELSAIVMKALAKKPDDRHASMRDLRQELDRALGPPRVATPAVGAALLGALAEPPRAPEAPIVHAATPNTVRAGAAPAKPPSVRTPSGASRDDALLDRLVGIVTERLASGKLELPALTPMTQLCLEQLRSPVALAFGQLASALSPNKLLASRLVRLANSPAFPSLAPAATLEQAIGRLGEKGLVQALIELEARPVFEAGDERVREALRRPWYHAIASAIAAERLVQTLRAGDEPMPLYLAALLYDVGKPIVARFLAQVERQTAGQRGPRWMSDEVWMRAVNATHRQVSRALAAKWPLPAETRRALDGADAIQVRDGRSDGNLVRFAVALAERQGYFLRRADADATELVLGQGRVALGLDDRSEAKLLAGFGGRVSILAPVRGA